jgi:hypothetical protein
MLGTGCGSIRMVFAGSIAGSTDPGNKDDVIL